MNGSPNKRPVSSGRILRWGNLIPPGRVILTSDSEIVMVQRGEKPQIVGTWWGPVLSWFITPGPTTWERRATGIAGVAT